MAKITIDLEDALMERLVVASSARRLTVEEWLRAAAEQAAPAFGELEIENASHRAMLAALDRPEGFYDSPREELHDRERDRAEAYVSARDALLDLIDTTQGDMGARVWSRSALYEA